MKKAVVVTAVLLILVALAGCAPGPNPMADVPDEEGEIAGFWKGLWKKKKRIKILQSLINERPIPTTGLDESRQLFHLSHADGRLHVCQFQIVTDMRVCVLMVVTIG